MPDKTLPPQHQETQPGIESAMRPRPQAERDTHGCGKLAGKLALITGGDSGIGRAVAFAYAKEGADIAIVYLNEHGDARETREKIEASGRACIALSGDVGDEAYCREAVQTTIERFGRLDVLVNNAAEQHPQKSLVDISRDQIERTFRTNIFSMFYMTKAALPHLKAGAHIINSASVTAYRGSAHLIDYAATKGAIVAFTRSLSLALVEHGIYVNAVAPGPIWTPLIPASFSEEEVAHFGGKAPMSRPGQPEEIAPSYVFLACGDSSYMTGQVLHPNGGEVVNG